MRRRAMRIVPWSAIVAAVARAVYGALAVGVGTLGLAATANARDITRDVAADPVLARELANACRAYCLGNRARATFDRVTVERTGPNAFAVFGRTSLVNHHYQEPTALFGAQIGGFDVFFYTVVVEGNGTLNPATCDLRVDAVRVLDDRLNLGDAARREVGKVYRIDNCQRFLTGL
jgi:hypothetical protein